MLTPFNTQDLEAKISSQFLQQGNIAESLPTKPEIVTHYQLLRHQVPGKEVMDESFSTGLAELVVELKTNNGIYVEIA